MHEFVTSYKVEAQRI